MATSASMAPASLAIRHEARTRLVRTLVLVLDHLDAMQQQGQPPESSRQAHPSALATRAAALRALGGQLEQSGPGAQLPSEPPKLVYEAIRHAEEAATQLRERTPSRQQEAADASTSDDTSVPALAGALLGELARLRASLDAHKQQKRRAPGGRGRRGGSGAEGRHLASTLARGLASGLARGRRIFARA